MVRGGREIGHHRLQLRLKPVVAERLAAQSGAAHRSAPQRQMGSRITEGDDPLVLDRLEGQTTSSDPVLPPRKHPRDLHDAVFRKLGRCAPDRVVIDDGLQHEGVVAVEPVREPARLGPGVEPSRPLGQRRHMPVERATLRPEGGVVDEPITNILVENLIEDRVGPRLRTGGNRCQAPDTHDQRQTEPSPAEQAATNRVRSRRQEASQADSQEDSFVLLLPPVS